jgi:hypothetical protein
LLVLVLGLVLVLVLVLVLLVLVLVFVLLGRLGSKSFDLDPKTSKSKVLTSRESDGC